MCTRWAILAMLGFSLAGCPFTSPQTRTFTSADTVARGQYGNLPPVLDGVNAGAEDDDAGGSVNAPREVVEPDVIRRQDNILYILNQHRGLTIVDLETHEVLAQLPTYGYPRDLYFHGSNAYVLVAQATEYTVESDTIAYDIGSRVYVVDVSSPAEALIQSQFPLEGELVDSRLVGDVLYAVGAEYQWFWYDDVLAKQQSDTSWVTSIDLSNSAAPAKADQIQFDGAGTVIQASPEALFVATPSFTTGGTTITYVDISDPSGDLAVRGSVDIAGHVADRFKLDAREGFLRAVSSGFTSAGRNVVVTTVDLADPDALQVLAQLELEDAANETLFATRFDGPRAYIVTYFVVDPLFVVDLTDPETPAVLGALEVPGWSTHIEPRGDRLITLGVDDTGGRRISVSVYDVGGPPQRLDIVTFGEDWAWTTAFSDVKAFTVLDDLIVVPFSGWNSDFGGYDRVQLISLHGDDLTLRGTVDLEGQGVRSLEYQDTLYGLSQEELAAIDIAYLDAPEVTNRITLAEDVADLVEIAPGRWAEVVRKNSTGETLVRVLDAQGQSHGDVTIDLGYITDVHAYGESLVIVGTALYGGIVSDGPPDATGAGSGYTVARVDCPADAAPSVAFTRNVDVTPYYGFYWWPMPYDIDVGGAEPGASVDAALWGPSWYPFTSDNRTFLLDNLLALRCYASAYNNVVGGALPTEGLALVDIETGAWDSTLGLALGTIVSMDNAGGTLIVGTKEDLAGSSALPECAFYVQTLDPAAASVGPRTNVPGTYVHYDPQNSVLVLRDQQWTASFNVSLSLRSVLWDGGESVTPVDSVNLPQSTYRVVGQESHVFFESHLDTYALHAVAIANNGTLDPLAPAPVTPQWGSLVDARGARAYVSLGGNAIAAYDANGDTVALVQLTPVMGYPSAIRFNPSGPAAILGYAGWAPL